jgi:hypothetical protein
MGVFAKYVGKEKFSDALVGDCLSFVQSILTAEGDADTRSAA